jgi:hypothetical protein
MAKILDAQRDSLPIFVVVSQSDVQYAFCNRPDQGLSRRHAFQGDMQTWFLSCPVDCSTVDSSWKKKKRRKENMLATSRGPMSCAFSISFATSMAVFGKWQ